MTNLHGNSAGPVHVSHDSSLMGTREWIDVNVYSFHDSSSRYDEGKLTPAALLGIEGSLGRRIEEMTEAREIIAEIRQRLEAGEVIR